MKEEKALSNQEKESLDKIKKTNKKSILLNVGMKLRAAREKKRLSQVSLTHKLYAFGFYVSVDSIISYELGRVQIPLATLLVIATILDMDLNTLKKDLNLKMIDM